MRGEYLPIIEGVRTAVPSFSDRRHHRAQVEQCKTQQAPNERWLRYKLSSPRLGLAPSCRLYSLRSTSTCTENTALTISSISCMHSVSAVRTKRLVVISGRHCSVRRHFHQTKKPSFSLPLTTLITTSSHSMVTTPSTVWEAYDVSLHAHDR